MSKKFLITGCQRSGTRFYAKRLAEQHGVSYIDENVYGVRDYEALKEILRGKSGFCVHGPAIKGHVQEFKADYPDAEIIWMFRDTEETIKSMVKKGWRWSAYNEWIAMAPLLSALGLMETYWCNLYWLIRDMSKALGERYCEMGIVDRVVNMSTLEGLEGFKKTSHGNPGTD